MGRVGERKTRSDKKKDIKPTLTIEMKDAIYRISYITHTPIKDIAEQLCLDVMYNRKMLERLSKHFKRDIKIDNTVFIGNLENEQIPKRFEGTTEKISIRFKQVHYNFIYDLHYVLGVSPSRVVAVLLKLALEDMATINRYVVNYLENEISSNQMKELQKVMRYVNQNNKENFSSWLSLLSAITAYTGGSAAQLKKLIADFLKDDQ